VENAAIARDELVVPGGLAGTSLAASVIAAWGAVHVVAVFVVGWGTAVPLAGAPASARRAGLQPIAQRLMQPLYRPPPGLPVSGRGTLSGMLATCSLSLEGGVMGWGS